jgi:hypothetical protein
MQVPDEPWRIWVDRYGELFCEPKERGQPNPYSWPVGSASSQQQASALCLIFGKLMEGDRIRIEGFLGIIGQAQTLKQQLIEHRRQMEPPPPPLDQPDAGGQRARRYDGAAKRAEVTRDRFPNFAEVVSHCHAP